MAVKVVILCGGLGTRLSEETKIIPKPLVKIGKYPILFHIMKIYSRYGFKDFVLALGYRGLQIKKYFKKNKIAEKNKWKINYQFTGKNTLTGTRIKKIEKLIKDDENFMCTYGDGLANINIKKLYEFHIKKKKTCTMLAVRPAARFGEIFLKGNIVDKFIEKSQIHSNWINGGFFVFNKKFFKYIPNKNVMLELDPIKKAIRNNQLNAFRHYSFWQCMDTLRDKKLLNNLYRKNLIAPWEK